MRVYRKICAMILGVILDIKCAITENHETVRHRNGMGQHRVVIKEDIYNVMIKAEITSVNGKYFNS